MWWPAAPLLGQAPSQLFPGLVCGGPPLLFALARCVESDMAEIQISTETAERLEQALGAEFEEALGRIIQLGIEAVRSMSTAELRSYFEERGVIDRELE